MINRCAYCEIRRIPLSLIRVTECQERYPERVMHYVDLMRQHPDEDAGLVSVAPLRNGAHVLLDGHHRLCAAILTGRRDVLAVVIHE